MNEITIKKKILFREKEHKNYNDVSCKIEINLIPNKKGLILTISGEIHSRAYGSSSGQIRDSLLCLLNNGELILDGDMSKEDLKQLLNIWKKWHLNNMRAGCKHQRKRKKDYIRFLGERFFYADNYYIIVSIPEFKECPKCHYKYGTAWLFEKIPNEIVDFILNLK